MQPYQSIDRVVDLTDSEKNVIYDITVEAAQARGRGRC